MSTQLSNTNQLVKRIYTHSFNFSKFVYVCQAYAESSQQFKLNEDTVIGGTCKIS